MNADSLDNDNDRYDNEDCNDHDNHVDSNECYDHDNHEDLNQHHMDALRNAERLMNGMMKSWLIRDNAYDNADIEI